MKKLEGVHKKPSYGELIFSSNRLALRANEAMTKLRCCTLCPRCCQVNRLKEELGKCGIGSNAKVAAAFPHGGEEPEISGWDGSGAIFFAGCSLHCLYCQNASISQHPVGKELSGEELSRIMIGLQGAGCHNINLVTPTHVVPHILEGVAMAAEKGLRLPIVYNSGGYDSLETLSLLENVVDIYLVDMKYSSDQKGLALSGIPDYVEVNRQAVKEMFRQVGLLQKDSRGIAQKGLIVRHLLLPGGVREACEIGQFLVSEISPKVFVHLIAHYVPSWKSLENPPLDETVPRVEFLRVVEFFRDLGLKPHF